MALKRHKRRGQPKHAEKHGKDHDRGAQALRDIDRVIEVAMNSPVHKPKQTNQKNRP